VTPLAVAVSGRGLVAPDEPVVHVDDEAFMRGRGAFETMRVYAGRPFRLAEHLSRLDVSCSRLGFQAPAHSVVEELAELVLRQVGAADTMMRVYATPGRGDGPVSLVVIADLPPGLDELRARGLALISVEFGPADLIGGVKSTSYALNMVAVDEAHVRGADDAVFLRPDGTVLEATTSNIWWRRGSTLYAPSIDLGILAGVTRSVLLEVAPSLSYDVAEGLFPVAELIGSDEAFTSSSVREVMPVVTLDGSPIGTGAPGPAAAALQTALRELACQT
jgi:branched-subunit amino acid aminotransferase/4-amino-4-deoxychorismate lyase